MSSAKTSPWAVAATAVVMFVVGAAIGYFGGSALDGDDGGTEAASTDTTTVPSTTAAADPGLVAYPDGSFEVGFPDGYQVGAEFFGAGQPGLLGRPTDIAAASLDAGGLNVIFDRRPDNSPEQVLETEPSADCPGLSAAEPFSHGEYTGLKNVRTGCPNGFEQHRVAVEVPGGTHLLVVATGPPGVEAEIPRALDTFRPGSQDTTRTAQYRPCTDLEPSTDPEFPIAVVFKNFRNEAVTYGFLNDAGGVENPTELGPGFVSGTNSTRTGDIYRFTSRAGSLDYTVTDAPTQCVVLAEDGFNLVP